MSDRLSLATANRSPATPAGQAADRAARPVPAADDLCELLTGTKTTDAQARRRHSVVMNALKLLERRGVTSIIEPPEQIAIPLMDAAARETRETLQDVWARLLANAIDPGRLDAVRAEYVQILQELEPLDALILDYLRLNGRALPRDIVANLRRRSSAVSISIRNLRRLALAELKDSASLLTFTDLGNELTLACVE